MFVVFPSMYMDLGFAKVLTDSGTAYSSSFASTDWCVLTGITVRATSVNGTAAQSVAVQHQKSASPVPAGTPATPCATLRTISHTLQHAIDCAPRCGHGLLEAAAPRRRPTGLRHEALLTSQQHIHEAAQRRDRHRIRAPRD